MYCLHEISVPWKDSLAVLLTRKKNSVEMLLIEVHCVSLVRSRSGGKGGPWGKFSSVLEHHIYVCVCVCTCVCG